MPSRTTSSAKAQNADSFVPMPPSDAQSGASRSNVEEAALKSLLIAYDRTPQADFQVIFPVPGDERLGVIHTRHEQLKPLRPNLQSGNVQGDYGLQLVVTLTKKDPETDRVSAEEIVVIEFPSPVYKHAVHIFRESRTLEVWEIPLELRSNEPEIVFRRWAFLLDPYTMGRTNPFFDLLEREFRKLDITNIDDGNTARDFSQLAISRASATSRALSAPDPQRPVVVRFDKTFKKELCFTGFLASPEMQNALSKLTGKSSAETTTPEAHHAQRHTSEAPATHDEQVEEVSRSRQRKIKRNQARKAAAENRAKEEENRQAKAARGGKGRKATVDADAE
ncbi:MAG: hypothetical protein Q9211_000095 [Gyalolechia sp. 1 TL-2023]